VGRPSWPRWGGEGRGPKKKGSPTEKNGKKVGKKHKRKNRLGKDTKAGTPENKIWGGGLGAPKKMVWTNTPVPQKHKTQKNNTVSTGISPGLVSKTTTPKKAQRWGLGYKKMKGGNPKTRRNGGATNVGKKTTGKNYDKNKVQWSKKTQKNVDGPGKKGGRGGLGGGKQTAPAPGGKEEGRENTSKKSKKKKGTQHQ